MKLNLKTKMVKMMMLSTLVTPVLPLDQENPMKWETNEQTKETKIYSLEITDGKPPAKWVYTAYDKSGVLQTYELPMDEVTVMTGNKNQLDTIKETIIGHGPGNSFFYDTETRYEITVEEKTIAKQAAETSNPVEGY